MNGFQKTLLLVAALLPGVLFAAEADFEKMAGVTPEMLRRAEQFRAAIQTDGGVFRSGVYLYEKRSVTDYADAPEKLAARLRLLGLTDVYLSCRSADKAKTDDRRAWRKKFIAKAHEYGMRVHGQTLERGRLYIDDNAVRADCDVILEYNKSVAPAERFDGVSADLEPHIFKSTAQSRPAELKLIWDSQKNDGPGKDNDLLLKRTVDAMAVAKTHIAPLPLSEAVAFFFQTRHDSGAVRNGSAGQFLRHCDFLIVMAYNYKKTRIWEMAEPTIRGAGGKPASVSICLKTTMGYKDGKVDPTSLQTLGWDPLIEAMAYNIEKGKKYPAFRGVDIFEFQGLEMMWTGRVGEKAP